MDLTTVIQTIEKDYPEAAQELSEYGATFSKTIDRVGALETDLKTAAEKRDALKTTIRKVTGLTEITEDALVSVFTKGSDEKVKVLQTEISQLQNKLGENSNVVEELKGKYENQIFGLKLDRAASMLGAADEVHNQHAYNVVLDELGKNAEFDGENIVYKNQDGTTRYTAGGQPATIQSVYEEIKADENFTYMFKEQYKSGGGKKALGPTANASGHALRRSKMTDAEQAQYISKHGVPAYKQLPL
jgi:acylphosphatase